MDAARRAVSLAAGTVLDADPPGTAVVAEAGHPSVGVLVDALHLARGAGTPSDLAAVEPRLLPYAQLCDAVADSPGDDALVTEALDERLLPGDGALPLADLLGVLPAGAPVSVELRSRHLRETYPDPVERARVVAAATRRLPGLARP